MDIESRISEAMRQLEKNVEKAARNPEEVLQGGFSSTSRNVTVWVDALGRTERCRIAPNSVAAGDEWQLIEDFNEATKKAQQKAANLEFNAASQETPATTASRRRSRSRPPVNEDWEEGPASWLH